MAAHNFIDLTGSVFGRLTVVQRIGSRGSQALWLCKCLCGNEKELPGSYLRTGDTQSCGCLARELTVKRSIKHGDSINGISPEYRTWSAMIS